MTCELKIGDLVERINGSNDGVAQGDRGVVKGISGRTVIVEVAGSRTRHMYYNLKLVIPAPLTVEQALAFLKDKGEVQFTPKFEPTTVYLNSRYAAVVHKDHVEVGCQNFDFNAIEELYTEVMKVKKHGK